MDRRRAGHSAKHCRGIMDQASLLSLLCLLRIMPFFFKFKTNCQRPDCRGNAMWLMILHNEWPWYQPAGSQLCRESLSVLKYVRPWLLIPNSAEASRRNQETQKRHRRSGHRSHICMKLSCLILRLSHLAQYCKITTPIPSVFFYLNAKIFLGVATCRNANIDITIQNRESS